VRDFYQARPRRQLVSSRSFRWGLVRVCRLDAEVSQRGLDARRRTEHLTWLAHGKMRVKVQQLRVSDPRHVPDDPVAVRTGDCKAAARHGDAWV